MDHRVRAIAARNRDGVVLITDKKASGIKVGWFGVDPAYYIWKRHSSSVNDNGLTEYNDATGEGFSMTYCFNAFANIDVRTSDPKCQ